MRTIAYIDYSEFFRVLTIVFEDGEHECYLNVNKKEAWLILQKFNKVELRQVC